MRRQPPKSGQTATGPDGTPYAQVTSHSTSAPKASTPSTIASVLSLGALGSSAQSEKAAKLSLTAHHLYYLLCKIEEIGIQVGPMSVRLENIHSEASPANYVSFLNQSHRSKTRSDRDSIHSVSSMRSMMSGVSTLWNGFGIRSTNTAAKTEKAKAQFSADLKYLYSAFTKIPCLRLSPDHNARLIRGYEEFPFDTAVPLLAFKNVSSLEISDVDFRQFYGWDKISEQLRSLTVKRAYINDVSELLIGIVLDDMDKRRRRSSRAHGASPFFRPSSPPVRVTDAGRGSSMPSSPVIDDRLSSSTSPRSNGHFPPPNAGLPPPQLQRNQSASPTRPGSSSKREGIRRPVRTAGSRVKRSGSASSTSSTHSSAANRSGSSTNLLVYNFLPASKWSLLRHLSLADNSLTSISASCLAPLANTLSSLDLSSNLFTEVPDAITALPSLQTLNLANCMIESLHSLMTKTLPAITVLSVRANRLNSLAGIEQLRSLERLDLRDNRIQDPTELARLTGSRGLREIWVWRNPFAKTHTNYRVTIFNLFRETPGIPHDLLIDSSGPGYNERRQLKDRVIETDSPVHERPPAKVDVGVRVSEDGRSSITTVGRHSNLTETNHTSPGKPRLSQDEADAEPAPRKKGARRRIIDLAHGHDKLLPSLMSHETSLSKTAAPPSPSTHKESVVHHEPKRSSSESPVQAVGIPNSPPSNPSSPKESTIRGQALARELKDSNLNGDDYRQKLEALREEVGSNWLSVLTEQGSNDRHIPSKDLPSLHRTGFAVHEGIPLRAPSQPIVGGSRTIG